MNPKVLFVDDDENILSAAHRNFKNRYDLDIALGAAQALRALEEHGPYAVVVADMAMPGMNGIEFLKAVQGQAPDTIRIMFTGHPGPLTLLEAINSGQVFRFVTKPCPPEELARVVDAGIHQYLMVTGERDLLEATLARSIEAMTGILEILEPALYESAQLLAQRVTLVATALGVPDVWPITVAAWYSPLWLLSMPAPLRMRWATEDHLGTEDQRLVDLALEKAAGLLRPIPRMESVARIIACQGKGFDGTGIPEGPLQGEAIPLGARILRAAQDFGAIESSVKSVEVALEALRMRRGRYDPAVLAALASILRRPLQEVRS